MVPWFLGGENEEEELYLQQVIMDSKILQKALRRGREEETEVGFYMIGLIKNRQAHVYDILEFPYLERSGASVVSNPEKKGSLFNSVPAGLEVIGIMHKHPSGMTPSFSSIDKRTFLEWSKSGTKAHIIFSDSDVRAYTVKGKKIREIGFKTEETEEISSLMLELPITIKLFYPTNSRILDLVQTLEKTIKTETLKRFSPVRFKKRQIMENISGDETLDMETRNIIHVASPNQTQFTYRFFATEGTTFHDLKGKIRSTLSLDEDSEFYTEAGRVLDKTPVSKLTGHVIYPRTHIRDLITQEVTKQMKEAEEAVSLKEMVDQLAEEVHAIKSEIEALTAKLKKVGKMEQLEKEDEEKTGED